MLATSLFLCFLQAACLAIEAIMEVPDVLKDVQRGVTEAKAAVKIVHMKRAFVMAVNCLKSAGQWEAAGILMQSCGWHARKEMQV